MSLLPPHLFLQVRRRMEKEQRIVFLLSLLDRTADPEARKSSSSGKERGGKTVRQAENEEKKREKSPCLS